LVVWYFLCNFDWSADTTIQFNLASSFFQVCIEILSCCPSVHLYIVIWWMT
jgi:hypothetical protein